MRELKIEEIYKHYKGDLYGDNTLRVKPYEMFFKEINKNSQKYRFELQNIKSAKG